MKFKKFLLVMIILLCSVAVVVATKWSDYGTLASGNIDDTDTFLMRDISDTSLAATGTQKQYAWATLKADLASADFTKTSVSEVIAANWNNTSFPWTDNEVDNKLTIDLLRLPLTTAEPTDEAVGNFVHVDIGAWNPAGLTGSVDYIAVCAAAGSPGTWVAWLKVDGSIPAAGINSQTPVHDTAANFLANFTGEKLKGGTFVCTTAGTSVLPAIATGYGFTYIAKVTGCIIDPNASDSMLTDMVQQADGENITNVAVGDMAVLKYNSAAGWLVQTDGWTQE